MNFFSRLDTVTVKLAALLAITVAASVGVLGASLIHVSDRQITRAVNENYVRIAERAANETALFLSCPRDAIVLTATLMSTENAWEAETVLTEMTVRLPVFIRMSYFDATGVEKVTSELGSLGVWKPDLSVFERLRRMPLYVSDVRFSDVRLPYVVMGAPVVRAGVLKGYLLSQVDLSGLWQIVDAIRVGSSGAALVINADGRIVAHRDKSKVMKGEVIAGRGDADGALCGKSGVFSFEAVSGRVIAAYAPMRAFGWGLIIEQKESEAYATSRLMQLQAVKVLTVVVLFAVLLSVPVAMAFSRRIKRLTKHFEMLSLGVTAPISRIRGSDEISQLMYAFNETAARLERSGEQERKAIVADTAAWISHELKNCLVSIKTFVQIFPQRYHDAEFLEKFKDLIPSELDRFERLLKQFSDYSAGDALEKSEILMGSLIATVCDLLEEQCREKGIGLFVDIPETDRTVPVDVDRIKQVFINLISNACKAMSGGGAVKISLREFQIGTNDISPWVEIRVSDTGSGIPPDRLERIFKPFYSEGEEDKGVNSGLGLPICRRIIEQHGGYIRAESVLGQGATFVIELPSFDPDKGEV